MRFAVTARAAAADHIRVDGFAPPVKVGGCSRTCCRPSRTCRSSASRSAAARAAPISSARSRSTPRPSTHVYEFVWDCRWRAEQEGWTDCFGFPDQIRAAREYDWRCFERWEPVARRATHVYTAPSSSSRSLGDAQSGAKREHHVDARLLRAARAGEDRSALREPASAAGIAVRVADAAAQRARRDDDRLVLGDPASMPVDHRRRHVAPPHRRDRRRPRPSLARRVEQPRIGAGERVDDVDRRRRAPSASSIGGGAGSARRKITSPSSITPSGPSPGLSNASSACVCAFVTSSAAKTRSDITTITPQPARLVARRDAHRGAEIRRARPIRDRSTCASRR